MKKFQHRSVTADLLIKIIAVIVVSFITLFLFNYLISGTFYAVDFWSMISGVITTVAAIVALIVFLRNIIINNLYEICNDYVGNEFYRIIARDEILLKEYKKLEKKYEGISDETKLEHNSTYMSELDVLYRKCYINAFEYYLKEMWWLGKLVIKIHSFILSGNFSLHMEYMRAYRRDWFKE